MKNRETWPGVLADKSVKAYELGEARSRAWENEQCVQPEAHIRRWAATVMCMELEIELLRADIDRIFRDAGT